MAKPKGHKDLRFLLVKFSLKRKKGHASQIPSRICTNQDDINFLCLVYDSLKPSKKRKDI